MGVDTDKPRSGTLLLTRRALTVGLGSCAASSFTAGCAALSEPEAAEEQASSSMRVWTRIKAETPMITTGAELARVHATALRVLDASGLAVNRPEFALFHGPNLRAIVLPGGKIGVFTGLLNLCACDGELAAVLCRELGYLTAHPINPSEKPKHFLAWGRINPRNKGSGAWPPGTYSHAQEIEADVLGLTYAAKAGYDPRDVLSFWRKVSLQRQAEPTSRPLTAPPDNQRLERIVLELRKMGYQV